MKMHRALSVPALAVAAALCWAAAPQVWAQTVTASAMEAGVTVRTVTSATVSVSGTVSGQPESVSLSGKVTLESTVVWSEINPASASTRVDIDLSGVSGVGKSTKLKYVTTAREIALRPLSTTDMVEFTFPFYVNASSSPRTGLARFSLMYDVNTGALTAVSGTLTSP